MTNAVRVAFDPNDAPQAPVDRSVRVATAAALLDCDESFVRKLIRQKKLQGHRMGVRGIRIFVWSIDAYRKAMSFGDPAPTPQKPTKRREQLGADHQEALAHLHSLGCL